VIRSQDTMCGIETSCYSCLRGYRNQFHHATLSRHEALEVLDAVLGDGQHTAELQQVDFDPDTHELIAAAMSAGYREPVPGYELDDPAHRGWMVEAAWPDARVALTVDRDGERDEWLTQQNWTARHIDDWTPITLLAALDL